MNMAQVYVIDGEQLTRGQIIARLADDFRRKRFAVSTIDARLRNGIRTWDRMRRSEVEGRAISKARFANWIVTPGKPQHPKPAGVR